MTFEFGPALCDALAPAEPGRRVMAASKYFKGARHTKEQIISFAEYWSDRAATTLASHDRYDDGVVVVLGDSLSQGIGATSPAEGHIGLLFGTDTPVVNLSRSGAKVADVMETQLPALREMTTAGVKTQLVICTVGSNDLVMQWQLGSVAEALTDLARELPANSVMSSLPSGGSFVVKAVNRRFMPAAETLGHDIAPVDAHYKGFGVTASDHFHPNDKGYAKFVNAFETLDAVRAAQPGSARSGQHDAERVEQIA